jgi:ribosomal protein S27AE
MKNEYVAAEDLEWKCGQCGCRLQPGPVTVEYMGNHFATELAKCPECGLAFVSETVALGKMAEVEQILEDK